MTTQREAAIQPKFDRGTPETRTQAKKRGPGTMQTLIDKGTIGGYETRAADEIERVFNFITAGLTSKIMSYEERTSPGKSDRVPAWFYDAYHSTYLPWANALGRRFFICQAILIDGWSVRAIREAVRRDEFDEGNKGDVEYQRALKAAMGRERNVTAVFVDMLRDYAIRAQWVDAGTLDDWRREMERAA